MDDARRVTRDQLHRFAAEFVDPADICVDEVIGGFYAALDPVEPQRFYALDDFKRIEMPAPLAEFMRTKMPEPAAITEHDLDDAVPALEEWPQTLCPVFVTTGTGGRHFCVRPRHDDADHRFVHDHQHRPRPVEADEIVTVKTGESWIGSAEVST